MRLFSEEVATTSSNSPLNVIQVQDFSEIFFGVYEIEINNNKYPVEKISEHDGDPVVSIPVEMGDKTVNYPFVLTKGNFEVVFNEKSEYVDIFKYEFQNILPEIPIETMETLTESVEDTPVNDISLYVEDEIQDILNEIVVSDYSKKIKILECSDNDIKISNSDTLNIIQVPWYDETFFNVYEILVNGKNFQVEKVNEYLGNPVVSISIEIDDEYRTYPFLLIKGNEFHIFFNEDSDFDMLNKIIVEHVDNNDVENLVIEEEPIIPEIIVDYDKELLKQEINDTKRKAYNLVNRKLKDNKNKNLRLIKEKAESWEKKLNTIVLSSKEILLAEFLRLIKEAETNISDKNDFIISEIKLTIDNKLDDTVNSLMDNINQNINITEKSLRDNITQELPKIYEERVKPFLQKERANLFKSVDDRIKSGQIIIDRSLKHFSEMIDNINIQTDTLQENLEEKAVDIELTLQNLIKENIKIIEDRNNKFHDDTLSRIGIIDKKVDNIHENFGKSIIKSKLDLKEFVDEQIKTLEEDNNNIRKSLSKIDDLDLKTDDISENLKEKIEDVKDSTLIILNDKIKNIEDKNKKIIKESDEKTIAVSNRLGVISKELCKKITDTESTIKKIFSDKIAIIEESHKNFSKDVNSNNYELGERINETSEILNEKINDVEGSIKEFFNEKIKLLEEDSTNWKQENEQWKVDSRDEFIKLFEDARDNLINEVSQIKNDQYIEEVYSPGVENKDWEFFKKDFEQKIDKKFDSYKAEIRKYIVFASGGGSVAMQFADGGTMNGDLSVNGDVTVYGVLSASQYLGLPDSGGSDAYKYSWSFLSLTWSSEPVITASIVGGDVYTYSLSGVDRYRFVPSPYAATNDSFYYNFDGMNLTGFIISRG